MLHNVNVYIKDLKTAMDKVPPNCDQFQIIVNADKKPSGEHRFNAPVPKEVAIVIVGQQFEKRDIILQSRDNKLQRISELHRLYDALQYPLMFCRGEDGYSVDIAQVDPKTKLPLRKKVSAASFYAYRMMVREDDFNNILLYRTLTN